MATGDRYTRLAVVQRARLWVSGTQGSTALSGMPATAAPQTRAAAAQLVCRTDGNQSLNRRSKSMQSNGTINGAGADTPAPVAATALTTVATHNRNGNRTGVVATHPADSFVFKKAVKHEAK